MTEALDLQHGAEAAGVAPRRLAFDCIAEVLRSRTALAAHHRAKADERTAPLFIRNPLSGHGMDNLFSTHPATENRIAALPALAQERGST